MNQVRNEISSKIQENLEDTTETCDLIHVINSSVMEHNLPLLRDQTAQYLSVLNHQKDDSNIVPPLDSMETLDASLDEVEEENESTTTGTKESISSSTSSSNRRKRSISKLNENDERLINLPQKKTRNVLSISEDSDANEDEATDDEGISSGSETSVPTKLSNGSNMERAKKSQTLKIDRTASKLRRLPKCISLLDMILPPPLLKNQPMLPMGKQ
jgi:hypothetical protein